MPAASPARATSSSSASPRRPTRSTRPGRSSSSAASARARPWRPRRSGPPATTRGRWPAASSAGPTRVYRWSPTTASSPTTDRLVGLLDVDGLGALVPGLLLVRHPGAFGEGAVALRRDSRVVDEQVAAALVGRDEAEALVVVKPLHGARGHAAIPLSIVSRVSPAA